MTFYNRKSPRILNYDYATENYYFITICTHNRKCLLGNPLELNAIGKIVEQQMNRIPSHYKDIEIDKYVVMPNHVHMILVLKANNTVRADQIVGQLKSGITREVRKFIPNIELWQRSFHDHIIRNQQSYEKIWTYIENNPQKWKEDCFYVKGDRE